MVEVHTLDAWSAPASARGPAHAALSMLGGFAAPAFLYLAGLSQALGAEAARAKGAPAGRRVGSALRRAGELLAVAYLFRAAEYLLGFAFLNPGGWRDLLRVDILNVIAVALAAAAPLAALPPRAAAGVAASAAACVALATPLVAGAGLPPHHLLDYLWATYPRANFTLFPWAGFLLAGAAAGRAAAWRWASRSDGAAAHRAGGLGESPVALLACGAALVAAGGAGAALPAVYAHQDFWHTSPAWWAIRLGVLLAATGLLQRAEERGRLPRWEALACMGRHSLLAYAASVELTYGLLSRRLHRRLGTGATLAGIAAMLALSWAIARAADAWRARHRRAPPSAKASGAVQAS